MTLPCDAAVQKMPMEGRKWSFFYLEYSLTKSHCADLFCCLWLLESILQRNQQDFPSSAQDCCLQRWPKVDKDSDNGRVCSDRQTYVTFAYSLVFLFISSSCYSVWANTMQTVHCLVPSLVWYFLPWKLKFETYDCKKVIESITNLLTLA